MCLASALRNAAHWRSFKCSPAWSLVTVPDVVVGRGAAEISLPLMRWLVCLDHVFSNGVVGIE